MTYMPSLSQASSMAREAGLWAERMALKPFSFRMRTRRYSLSS